LATISLTLSAGLLLSLTPDEAFPIAFRKGEVYLAEFAISKHIRDSAILKVGFGTMGSSSSPIECGSKSLCCCGSGRISSTHNRDEGVAPSPQLQPAAKFIFQSLMLVPIETASH
jgi:hypothetical protein